MVLGVPVPEHLAAEGQLVEDATRCRQRSGLDKVVADSADWTWVLYTQRFLVKATQAGDNFRRGLF